MGRNSLRMSSSPSFKLILLGLLTLIEKKNGFLMSRTRSAVPATRPKTTKRFSSSAANDDELLMTDLRNRMKEVKDSATKLPFVLLDSMLPRQVLNIKVENELLTDLVLDRLQKETPNFGMLGLARLITGQKVHLKYGVEVEIVDKEFNEDKSVRLELKAGRRFSIQGDVKTSKRGWTEGRVKFLNSKEQEEAEVKSGEDRMAVARAISKSKVMTSPNLNVEDNGSLIDEWIRLARDNEKIPGQIDLLLQQLGEIPPEDQPSERAFWVGALINPIPAMGVATEIRPSLLLADTSEQRVQVALDGLNKSIKHMDGSEKLW